MKKGSTEIENNLQRNALIYVFTENYRDAQSGKVNRTSGFIASIGQCKTPTTWPHGFLYKKLSRAELLSRLLNKVFRYIGPISLKSWQKTA